MRNHLRFVVLAGLVAGAASCSSALRQSRAPVLLVVDSLQAASGGGFQANTFRGTLFSDVIVLLRSPAPCSDTNPCPTYYSDSGQVTLSSVAKNSAVAPTEINSVTITRYHVDFTRADGRNTPGVDVPYGFDGAVTGTIPGGGSASLTFELVRHTSKLEAPLVQLVNSPAIIHSIAKVTFYGRDLAGNDISVAGSISVDFGNFGDQ
jgi:hypothetical protein